MDFCVNWGVGKTLHKRWICVLRFWGGFHYQIQVTEISTAYRSILIFVILSGIVSTVGSWAKIEIFQRGFECFGASDYAKCRSSTSCKAIGSILTGNWQKIEFCFGWLVCFLWVGDVTEYETVLMKLLERTFSATHIRTFLGRRKRRVRWKENAMRFFNNSLDVGFFTWHENSSYTMRMFNAIKHAFFRPICMTVIVKVTNLFRIHIFNSPEWCRIGSCPIRRRIHRSSVHLRHQQRRRQSSRICLDS